MLKRQYRFSGLGSVRPALRHGRRIRGSKMAASVLQTKNAAPRFSILVSKKVSKKAVVRNRIRRRVFEALRENNLGEMPPHDVVISVFDSHVAEMPWVDVQAEVQSLLKKANLVQ